MAGTKTPDAPATGEAVAAGVDAGALLAQLEALQAQVAEMAAAAAAGGGDATAALVAALEKMQAPSVTVEQPKHVPLPPKHDDVEEGFEPVTFRSRGRNFKVIRVSAHRNLVNDSWVPVTTGRYYDFAPNGDLKVLNSDVAAFLRSCPDFNQLFWELGNAPGADKELKPLLQKIARAAVSMDDETLAEIERQERRRTAPRSVVITTVLAAREMIQDGAGALDPEPVA